MAPAIAMLLDAVSHGDRVSDTVVGEHVARGYRRGT